jgi:phospholipid/cholesterol/gamma-HCH transport system permease protein
MFLIKFLKTLLDEIGGAVLFLRDLFWVAIKTPCDRVTVLEQIYLVSVQSMVTTASSGFFVGALLTVQFSMQLQTFGSVTVLGGLSTSGTVRELGPLLIAFMLSGKVGAFTSAELGTMKVTEQIDAMRCLGTNPLQHLILPRFIGIIISSFFLLLLGLLMSILGGTVMAGLVAHISPYEYISTIPLYVTGPSIIGGLFKCLMFSLLLATICTYKGYTTTGGAKGVGRTVLATALSTMVGITLMDWFTSYIAQAVSTVVGV